MLRRIYDWLLAQAEKPGAERVFALVCFAESSFFPIPSEVLMLPMCLKHPERSWRFATIASIASLLGAAFGYFIGYAFYEAIAAPILAFWGEQDKFEALRTGAATETMTLMMITSSLAHLPPIKLVTILSGALMVNFWLFMAIAAVVRTARFFALAYLLRRYGEPIREVIERHMLKVTIGLTLLIVLLWLLLKTWH